MKKILLSVIALVAMWAQLYAQDRTVSGKVVDENDQSLPGVNVILKGTTTGTTTDIDGNYRLTIPSDGGTLVFSFIGFVTQQVSINNRSVIDLTMSTDVQELTEVVVTAQGIERSERALGYGVENVDGEQIQQVAEPDPLRALQGKIAGVNIQGTGGTAGSNTRIQIRGNSSFLGNNQPLFVVDGIPYDNNTNFNNLGGQSGLNTGGAYANGISALDPNNIESMTVLKGASAAALYGTRAANGVIVITTKTGSARKTSRKGLEIKYSSTVTAEKISRLPNYQNGYGTGTNFNFQFANGSWGAPFPGTQPYANTDSIPHPYSSNGVFGNDANGDGVLDFPQFEGTQIPYVAQPDNVESLFETGIFIENSLSITGGTDNSTVTATLSQVDNNGYIPNSEFNRYNISVGGRTSLDNGFIIGTNLQYTRTLQSGPQLGVGSLGSNNPSFFARTLLLGRNWNVTDFERFPFQNPADGGSAFWVGRGNADHPIWSANFAGFSQKVDRMVASFDVSYDINEWVSASYKVGANTYSQFRNSFINPGSTGPASNPGVGQIITDDVNYQELDMNAITTFTPQIGRDYSLTAVIGWNYNQRTSFRQAFQGQNFVIFGINDIDNTNNVSPLGPTTFDGNSQRRIFGAYADVTLGYRDWAYLTLTGRNDWSSTLPVDNRSFFYPAITASVVLTDALNISSDLINYVKVRGSWAEVGNDTDPFQLQPLFLINESPALGIAQRAALPITPAGASAAVPGATLSNIARDPNLKPEQTQETEVGLELGLWNNRISLDVAYYYRLSKDQIAQVTLPPSTGFTSLFTNFGELSNEGVEIGLDFTPVQLSNGFKWKIYGTFTHNKNVVEELTSGLDELTFGFGFAGGVINALRPGQEYGVLLGSVDARDDEGNLLIDPSNGQLIQAANREVIGNPNPDFIVGLTNTLTFKGITVRAVIDWKQGGDIWSNMTEAMLGRGVLEFQGDREQMRIIPGVYGDPNTREPLRTESGEKIPNQTLIETNTLFFGQTFASNASNEWNVYDATVIRLREISVSYELPNEIMEKTPFGSARVSFNGRNLWWRAPNLLEDSNIDPEISQFNANSNQFGQVFSQAPSTKRFGGSIAFTF